LYRLRRCLNRNDAARRAAAGYLSLLVQRKVTQRKHAPEPPKAPALLAPAGREPNSPSASVSDKTSEHSEQCFFIAPGSDTGSRRPPAEAAMLGGGYGSQRQRHKMKRLIGVGWGERSEPQQSSIVSLALGFATLTPTYKLRARARGLFEDHLFFLVAAPAEEDLTNPSALF
jgi:hypothetical protein